MDLHWILLFFKVSESSPLSPGCCVSEPGESLLQKIFQKAILLILSKGRVINRLQSGWWDLGVCFLYNQSCFQPYLYKLPFEVWYLTPPVSSLCWGLWHKSTCFSLAFLYVHRHSFQLFFLCQVNSHSYTLFPASTWLMFYHHPLSISVLFLFVLVDLHHLCSFILMHSGMEVEVKKIGNLLSLPRNSEIGGCVNSDGTYQLRVQEGRGIINYLRAFGGRGRWHLETKGYI